MAKIAILSAIAFVLMLFEFPLPVAPSFYKLDFSEVAVMIGGFALGPIPAVAIEGMKVILNLLFNGTITMGVGEFANFAIGCAMAVPAAAIYHRNKTRKSALIGMLVGTLVMTVTGVVLNYLVLIPAYVSLAHFPMDAIIGMGQAIFPFIKNTFDLVIACVTPFNLIKGVLVSLITILLYKHVSPLLHK
jgi:riboflavin transporter FmnP